MFALDDFDLYKYGPDDKLKVERTAFVLKLVFYKDNEELQKSFENMSKYDFAVRAFTMVSKESDVCTVHVVAPKIWDDREDLAIFGHEVYHCTYASHQNLGDLEKEANKEVGTTDEDKLLEEDRILELEGLEEECESNTRFDYITGCKELQETK